MVAIFSLNTTSFEVLSDDVKKINILSYTKRRKATSENSEMLSKKETMIFITQIYKEGISFLGNYLGLSVLFLIFATKTDL